MSSSVSGLPPARPGRLFAWAWCCWLVAAPAQADLWRRPAAAPAQASSAPHPAVARIIVPEGRAVSYGSGTLVDVRDQHGLVVTNWHVVRDATDKIEVVLPGGFRSYARALKVDKNWDLAALVIWRPPVEPVPLAAVAPRPGDRLTIAGYGSGSYRAASGRCTQYVAPGINFPYEMVEVSVQARQGDSGGPIFNEQGELAGVLFGAGRGTTSGSFAGRVRGFLASVVPDQAAPDRAIASTAPQVNEAAQQAQADMLAAAGSGAPSRSEEETNPFDVEPDYVDVEYLRQRLGMSDNPPRRPGDQYQPEAQASAPEKTGNALAGASDLYDPAAHAGPPTPPPSPALKPSPALTALPAGEWDEAHAITWQDIAGDTYYDQAKTVLAAIGVLAVVLLALKIAGG